MIAIALGLVAAVVMVATGVVVSSSESDRLTFLGVTTQTTTAQVFLTGAIFAWLFVIALWLLRLGMQRSGVRCAELAGRWVGLGSALGFGAKPGSGSDPGDGLSDAAGHSLGRSGPRGYTALGGRDGARYEEVAGAELYGAADAGASASFAYIAGTADVAFVASGGPGGPAGSVSSGARGDFGGSPQRIDGRTDVAAGSVLGAAAGGQTRPLTPGDDVGPGTRTQSGGTIVGIGVNGGGQSGEIGGIPRFVPGEHGGAEREGGDR